jgi:CDP-glucose 4,6-dehydratase
VADGISALESMGLKKFYSGKRVFITGHTGFKGSWLCLLLDEMDASVMGYSLPPPTVPNLFELARINSRFQSVTADIRDGALLTRELSAAKPDIVIHLAAQPLVRASYLDPQETYTVNVMGTVNLFEAVRHCPTVRAVVNVTTDKVYENHERLWGYRENEALGGYDPYSSSKACSELVTTAYRNSFFNPRDYSKHRVAIACARAGNVIGGGDWGADRLVPDAIRAILARETITIRNPGSVRPWQHVLEPLVGYLLLVRSLYDRGPEYGDAWNFGPDITDDWPVERLVQEICSQWGEGASYTIDLGEHSHEAQYLRLDSTKARVELGWRSRWGLPVAVSKVVDWTKVYRSGDDLLALCRDQISEYMEVIGEDF